MSEFLPHLFTQQFSTNLQLRLQQMESKLRGRVMEGAHIGKAASPVQYDAPFAMEAPSGRFSPLNRTDTDFMRRWVFPQEREAAQMIDSFDRLQTIIDPTSAYVRNAASAVARSWDDAIISAATGTAQLGTDTGTLTSETFAQAATTATGSSSGLTIADTFGNSSTTCGLTVAKLIEARRIFRHLHVDIDAEQLTLVIGSQQEADLLSQVQVVSTEFNDHPTLVDGRLQRFLGWNIVVSERLSVASSIRDCLAICGSGLYLGIWQEMVNDVTVRKDLSSQPYQIYTKVMYGATRLEPGRVLKVQAGNDGSGADNI